MKVVLTQKDYKDYGIGDKARNMFILKENGFNVPNLFCISAMYLDEYLRERRVKITAILNNADMTDYVSMGNACDQVKRIIFSLVTDVAFCEQIKSAVRTQLPNAKAVAIHSSIETANDEHGVLTRRLGNYLNVDVKDIVRYVIRCFASVFQPEILKYYNDNQIPLSLLRMHVLVQEYSETPIIGTIFTANPGGLLNEAVIKVGKANKDNGSGELNVHTTYYYNCSDKKRYYEASKTSVLIPEPILDIIVENIDKIKHVFKNGNNSQLKIKDAEELEEEKDNEKKPLNYSNEVYLRIGFAILNDKFVILEIENMLNFKINNVIVLDSMALGRDMRGVNLPLTESFTSRMYSMTFTALANECIRKENVLAGFYKELSNVVTSVNGRLYYNLTNVNKLLKLIPLRNSEEPLRKFMHFDENIYFDEVSVFDDMSFFQWFPFAIRFLKMFYKANKLEEKFIENVIGNFALIEENNYIKMSVEEILTLLEDCISVFTEEWSAILLSEISIHICVEKLKQLLRTIGVKDPVTYIKPLLLNTESHIHKKALGKLAVSVVNNGLKDIFRNIKTDSDFRKFTEKDYGKFTKELNDFLEHHGKYIEGMYRLEDKNYIEHPIMLVKAINEILADTKKLTEYMEIKITKKPEFIMPPVKGFKRRRIQYYVNRIKENVDNREKVTELKMQAYLEARRVFRVLGTIFAQAKIIESSADIFYMRVGEVFDCIKQGDNLGDYIKTVRKIIEQRKEEYKEYFNLPDNVKLVFADSVYNKKVFNVHYNGDDKVEEEIFYLGETGTVAGTAEDNEDDEFFPDTPETSQTPPTPEKTQGQIQAEAIAKILGVTIKEDGAVEGLGAEGVGGAETAENAENVTPQTEGAGGAEGAETAENSTPQSENTAATPEKELTPEEEAKRIAEQARLEYEEKKKKDKNGKPAVELTTLTADELRDRF